MFQGFVDNFSMVLLRSFCLWLLFCLMPQSQANSRPHVFFIFLKIKLVIYKFFVLLHSLLREIRTIFEKIGKPNSSKNTR